MKLYLLASLLVCLAAGSYAYAQCNGGWSDCPTGVTLTDTHQTTTPWTCCDQDKFCRGIRGEQFTRSAAKYSYVSGGTTKYCIIYADGYLDNYRSPCNLCTE